MTPSTTRYDAFISYRHIHPDCIVAERLQTLLETYRPPKGIAEPGRKIKVFRDQSELPTVGDLDEALVQALESSRYLIVVLSAKTQESKWCMAEITYFKELHGGQTDHILPILADGTPEEAIPQILRSVKPGVRPENSYSMLTDHEREPLCCDVRAQTYRQRMKKLRTEFLRLAAPLLQCGFDDLYRREQRRQVRRIRRTAAVFVSIVMAFFTVILVNYCIIREKNATLSQQKRELQRSESSFLAAQAAQKLEEGDYQGAVQDAITALPNSAEPDRPYNASAESVLWDALWKTGSYPVYDLIELDSNISALDVSADGRRCYVMDESFGIHCFDCQTLEQVWETLAPVGSMTTFSTFDHVNQSFELSEKNNLLYVSLFDRITNQFDIVAMDCDTGERRWEYTNPYAEDTLLLSTDASVIAVQLKEERDITWMGYYGGYIHGSYSYVFLDAVTGEVISGDAESTDPDGPVQGDELYRKSDCFAEDNASALAVVYMQYIDDCVMKYYFYEYNTALNTKKLIGTYEPGYMDVFGTHFNQAKHTLLLMCYSMRAEDGVEEDGELFALSVDTETGEINWKTKIQEYYYDENGKRVYNYSIKSLFDTDNGRIICLMDRKLLVIDMETGNIIAENGNEESESYLLESEGSGIYTSGDDILIVHEDGSLSVCQVTGHGIATVTVKALENVLNSGSLRKFDLSMQDETLLFCTLIDNSQGLISRKTRLVFFRGIFSHEPVWTDALEHDEPVYTGIWAMSEEALCLTYGSSVCLFSDHSGAETITRVDTETGAVSQYNVQTNKDFEEAGEVTPVWNGNGLLLDDGFGSLLYYDGVSSEPEVLSGTAAPLKNYTSFYSGEPEERCDTQGMDEAVGRYKLAAARSRDGTAIAAVPEGDRFHYWVDGIAQTDVPFPDSVHWNQTADNTSLRIWMAGANGYLLCSDFPAEGATGGMEQFACYSTRDGTWHEIDDLSHGSTGRHLCMANEAPLFAVVDNDKMIRIYNINQERCVAELSLPVFPSTLIQVSFSDKDNYLMVVAQEPNQVFLYSLSDGSLVYREAYSFAYSYYFSASLSEQADGARVLLQMYREAALLDTDSWSKITTIDCCCYNSVTGCAVTLSNEGQLYLTKLPSVLELIQSAEDTLQEIKRVYYAAS